MSLLQSDVAHIRQALSVYAGEGQTVELRALDAHKGRQYPATYSGYYRDLDKAAEDAAKLSDEYNAKGVYIPAQQINSDLHARCADDAKRMGKGDATTSDTDVQRYRTLIVDLDAQRPSGIMATDEEMQAAFDLARTVREYLEQLGFPDPVRVKTGSGAHLLYRIDLPVEDAPLVEAVLKALDFLFSTDHVKVDTTVFNPARIIRVPGTVNRKGSSTDERPHRLAQMYTPPDPWQVADRALLEQVAAMLPQGAEPQQQPTRRHQRHTGEAFDVRAYLQQHGVGIASVGEWRGGTKYVLERCPWNPSHTDRSAYVVQFANGAIAAGCHHNSCQGKNWNDLRDALEGVDRKRYEPRHQHASKPRPQPQAAPKGDRPRIGQIVHDVAREAIAWLWLGYLALGKLALLDGDPGTGKSTIYADLAARLTTGRAWPGEGGAGRGEPGSVVIVTGEDGIADTIKPRLEEAGADTRRVLVVQTVPVYDSSAKEWKDAVPVLPNHTEEIRQAVQQMNASLLIIDPLMAHLSSDVNSYRDQDVRAALTPLVQMAEAERCAVLVVRHLNKMQGGNALYRGSGSIGIAGQARTAFMLGRHPEDQDRLVLAPVKSNVGKWPHSLELAVVSSRNDPDVGVIEWGGISQLTAQDLLAPPSKGRRDAKQAEAEDWLKDQLGDGEPHLAAEMWARSEDAGLTKRTVNRAKRALGVVTERIAGVDDGQGRWYWSLASGAAEVTKEPKDANTHNMAPLPGDSGTHPEASEQTPLFQRETADSVEVGPQSKDANASKGANWKTKGARAPMASIYPIGGDTAPPPQVFSQGDRVMTPGGIATVKRMAGEHVNVQHDGQETGEFYPLADVRFAEVADAPF
ncbi:MAG: AAA family ATPase [Bacteroidota bacterium]